MVKMSHSSRKRLVPSKVKVKDSLLSTPSNLDEDHKPIPKKKSKNSSKPILESVGELVPSGVDWLGYHPIALKKDRVTPKTHSGFGNNGKPDFKEQSSPMSLGSAVAQETGQDETSSNGNKEDEDDDDDESEDKIDAQANDPERLKAFNMFVRLFVDENLDRMVPISKQPKEKIQAIIDSCTRQFPEFAERARKRIRTYLKSCRRNKRCRESTWESSRPTPAHLTSVQAEQILAQACENESQNAKRMRMGLEPVGQPLPALISYGTATRPIAESIPALVNGKEESDHGNGSTSSNSSSTSTPEKVTGKGGGLQVSGGLGTEPENGHVRTPLSSSGSENQVTVKPERTHLIDNSNTGRVLNGNGFTSMSMYRPNFCQRFTRPFPGGFTPGGPTTPPVIDGFSGVENCLPNSGSNRNFSTVVSSSPAVANGNEIGPTDLSMKSKSLKSHKLNATEMTTVRQLITGYRESAAFLLRSADELEQLIVQQQ